MVMLAHSPLLELTWDSEGGPTQYDEELWRGNDEMRRRVSKNGQPPNCCGIVVIVTLTLSDVFKNKKAHSVDCGRSPVDFEFEEGAPRLAMHNGTGELRRCSRLEEFLSHCAVHQPQSTGRISWESLLCRKGATK